MEFELLPERKGYKANLHCHTTDSDGCLTPEQMKEEYKKRGYSVLAYTDHAYMRDRTALSDENFVAISGYEHHVEPPMQNGKHVKQYHWNFYSPRPDKVGMVGITGYTWSYYNQTFMKSKNRPERLVDKTPECPLIGGFYEDGYTLEGSNKNLEQAKKEGYLVVLNHPCWGRNDWRDLAGLKGLCGLEIYNSDCVLGGYVDDGEHCYDLMLRDGQRINCFAGDDNHADPKGFEKYGKERCGFGGYNYIYAEKLDYASVFDAMKKGNLYASSGAELRGVYLKDGKVHVGCEPAMRVRILTDCRADVVYMKDKPLTSAVFELKNDEWFRIVVETETGKKAYTKGYFLDEYQK